MRQLIEKAQVVFKETDFDKYEVLKSRDPQLPLGGKYSKDLVDFYASTHAPSHVLVLSGGELTLEPEKLKVGDYAKVVSLEKTSLSRGSHGFSIGEIVKLDRAFGVGEGFGCLKLDGESINCNNVDLADLIRATDEEVAEAKRKQAETVIEAKFAKINRKPNEYKKGDIVRVSRNGAAGLPIGHIDVVERVDKDGDVYFNTPNVYGMEYSFYVRGEVELITPVEARFDKSTEGDR